MRKILLSSVLLLLSVAHAQSRKFDLNGTITSAVPGKPPVVVTLTVAGREVRVQRETIIQISRGKLVDRGTLADLKTGETVNVWLAGDAAERVMLFRSGAPDVPR